jgi:hypothetical protein
VISYLDDSFFGLLKAFPFSDSVQADKSPSCIGEKISPESLPQGLKGLPEALSSKKPGL